MIGDTFTIAVTGTKGGTGRTTIVAHLGAALTRAGLVPMCFDLCAQNALGLHFGMPPGEPFGLVDSEATLEGVRDYLKRCEAKVAHLPYGEPNPRGPAEPWTLSPKPLDALLQRFVPRRCQVILLDLPMSSGTLSGAGLALTDLAIVPVSADAASFSSLAGVEARLRASMGDRFKERSFFVVSAFDASHQLSRDVRSVLTNALDDRLLPFAIHQDETVREALANRTTVDPQGDTHVVLDFERLAEWVRSRMVEEVARKSA